MEDTNETQEEVLKLFRQHKQHNKALNMINLTNNPDGEPISGLVSGGSDKPPSTNDKMYATKDARFRYHIWSSEMIAAWILGLSEQHTHVVHLRTLLSIYRNSDAFRMILNSFSQNIVVFNSCSTYCQCSIFESTSAADSAKAKDVSPRLLAEIFHSEHLQ